MSSTVRTGRPVATAIWVVWMCVCLVACESPFMVAESLFVFRLGGLPPLSQTLGRDEPLLFVVDQEQGLLFSIW